MAAQEVASLYATIRLDDLISTPLNVIAGRLANMGSALTGLGVQVGAFASPAVAGIALLTSSAMGFEATLTNVQAVTGQTNAQMAAFADTLLDMDTTFTSQQLGDTFYNVAGSVVDAASRMSILEAAVAAAEAGAADLNSTAMAITGTMNAYSMEAADAALVSDILTRTVGMGVGTMNDFATALPTAASLAARLGVDLEQLGTMTAYMTTRNISAHQATRYLNQAMIALLNPNAAMTAGLMDMGVESGSAAIAMYGLEGTLSMLNDTFDGNMDAMAQAIGSTEALQATLAITEDGYESFAQTFSEGVEGATVAARAIQLESATAQFNTLKSAVLDIGLRIGTALLPPVIRLMEAVSPLVDRIGAWAEANPALITQIAGLVMGAAMLAPVLIIAGQTLSGIGAIIGAVSSGVGLLGGAFTLLISPIGLAIVAAGLLTAAYLTNFGGVRDFIDTQVRPRLEEFFLYLGGVWDTVRPALEAVAGWFTGTALPGAIAFVNDTALPAIGGIVDMLGGIWTSVSPSLGELIGWFGTALANVITFINELVIPAIGGFITTLTSIWALAGPVLAEVQAWFLETGLPVIRAFIEETVIPAVQGFINILVGIWDAVRPALEAFRDGIQPIMDAVAGFIRPVAEQVNALIDAIGRIPQGLGAWEGIGQNAQSSVDMVTSGQASVTDWLNAAAGAVSAEFSPRAAGGPVSASQGYLVGEVGPELFVPNTSGTIIPNSALGSTAGGQTVNVYLTAYGSSPHELAEMVRRAVREKA